MTTSNLPQCWADVSDLLEAGVDRVILHGPPGTGKTFAGLTMGNIAGGAHRLICNEDMTSADITGHFMPTGGGTWKWHDGAVLRAWEGNGSVGGRVIIDEIDRASGDVLSLMLSMLDSPESASFLHPENDRTVKPNDGFSAVMTTNIEDMRELPTALKDRFPLVVRINCPHPDALTYLSEDIRSAAALSCDLDNDRRISLRTWKAFDQVRKVLGDERAAQLVFNDMWMGIIDSIKVNSVNA